MSEGPAEIISYTKY